VQSIRQHNEQAAATWGAGGPDYDKISEHVSDAIEHLVRRILPQPGERFLDIATGTGWTARRLSARGASVVGIDLGAPVIEAAKILAPSIDFRVGDAESLEFENESFDGITSTFGIMFAARPEDAARELTRVYKQGGRIGLVTWQPGGAVEGFFNVMKPYLPPPPSPAHPHPLSGAATRVFVRASKMLSISNSRPARPRSACPAGKRPGICSSRALVRPRRWPLLSNPGGARNSLAISSNITTAFAVTLGSRSRANISSPSGFGASERHR